MHPTCFQKINSPTKECVVIRENQSFDIGHQNIEIFKKKCLISSSSVSDWHNCLWELLWKITVNEKEIPTAYWCANSKFDPWKRIILVKNDLASWLRSFDLNCILRYTNNQQEFISSDSFFNNCVCLFLCSSSIKTQLTFLFFYTLRGSVLSMSAFFEDFEKWMIVDGQHWTIRPNSGCQALVLFHRCQKYLIIKLWQPSLSFIFFVSFPPKNRTFKLFFYLFFE